MQLLRCSGWLLSDCLPTKLKRALLHRSQQAACSEAPFMSVAKTVQKELHGNVYKKLAK